MGHHSQLNNEKIIKILRKSLDNRKIIAYIRNMKTNNRNYTTISIPKNFEHLIPKLQKTYAEKMGLNVSRGETVGIAVKNEFEKNSNAENASVGVEEK